MIKGLTYIENVIDDLTYDSIVTWLEDNKDRFETISSGMRKVMQFGYEYDYVSRKTKKIEDLPEVLNKLIRCVPNLDHRKFNQCIINRYEKGERITKHIDAKCFGDTIVCFTIGDESFMRFSLGLDKVDIKPKNRSVYIMKDDARYRWMHEMLPNSKINLRKGVRYSFTFRSV